MYKCNNCDHTFADHEVLIKDYSDPPTILSQAVKFEVEVCPYCESEWPDSLQEEDWRED